MTERQIKPVKDNKDKQRTYRENIGKYRLAVKHGFYFEAMLIDYAMLEDRLRSFLYHIGGLKTKDSHKFDNKNVKKYLKPIVSEYKEKDESDTFIIKSISGKMTIIKATLNWAAYVEHAPEEKYLKTLKSQYESALDIKGMLDALEDVRKWCDYRNEVIHALMNKNLESLDEQLEEQAIKGMEVARYIDAQIKQLKKGNSIRRSINLKA